MNPPGGSGIKNLPADAVFGPWTGKTPHAKEQLSLCAPTIEPVLWSLRATTAEARMPCSLCFAAAEVTPRRSLYTATREGCPPSLGGQEYACNAGDWGAIPGSGRSPGEGNGNPLQHSCLEKIPWTEEPGRLQSTGSQESDTTWPLHHHHYHLLAES